MKENCSNTIITLLPIGISIVSLVISAFVFIRTCWKERFHIECECVKWFASMVSKQPFYIWLIITNHSKLPVTILKIQLECNKNGKKHTAISRGDKHYIMSSRNGDRAEDYYSTEYPICIDGYSAFGGYIHFCSSDGHSCFEEQDVDLTLYTNRGKKRQRIKLCFGDNVYRAMQSVSGEIKAISYSDGTPINYQYDGIPD